MSPKELSALGLARADAAALASAGADPPGALTILVGPDTTLSAQAAELLARSALHPETAHLDLTVAHPSADRWTIAEVDERIRRRAALRPMQRTHIVVSDADQMAPAAHDHLLKLVEEPGSAVHFWFTVASLERLPVTLRSRAGRVLSARPGPASERHQLLQAAGASPQDVAQIAASADEDVRLALTVAKDVRLLAALHLYATATLSSQQPTSDSDLLVAAVIELAAGMSKTTRSRTTAPAPSASPRVRWDSLTPPARADGRRLIRQLLGRWETHAAADVSAADTTPLLGLAARRGQALAMARSEMATNAPVTTVLAALLSRCQGHPSPLELR